MPEPSTTATAESGSRASLLRRSFALIRRLEKHLMPTIVSLSLLSAIHPFITILMSAFLIDELGGARRPVTLALDVLLAVGANLLVLLASNGLARIKEVQLVDLDRLVEIELDKKLLSMDRFLEQAGTHVTRNRIIEYRWIHGGNFRKLIQSAEDVVRNTITVVLAVLATYRVFTVAGLAAGPGLLVALGSAWVSAGFLLFVLASIVTMVVLSNICSRMDYAYMDSVVQFNRVFVFHVDEYIRDYKAGKDIRLYNQPALIENEFMAAVRTLSREFARMGSRQGGLRAINAALTALIGGLVFLVAGVKAIAGLISVGSIVRYSGGILQFIAGSTKVVMGLAELGMSDNYLRCYFDYLALPDMGGTAARGASESEGRAAPVRSVPEAATHKVEFVDLSFRYPGSERYALRHVSLTLEGNRRLAVVGMNGSRKTTLVKLLCRLYEPTEGVILLDGRDIREYPYHEYAQLFSVVFQDFSLLAFPVGQNVATAATFDEARVMASLEKAGIAPRVLAMPKGVLTSLYKNFESDGIEVSGGEAQKIAISRAIYKDAPFFILDDPTAALDPKSEFDVYSGFDRIIGDKCAVYISHRLASCRFCDDIAVFHEGELIQRGSHDRLVADRDGKYFELWDVQAQYYALRYQDPEK